ncbi:MAG: hypothetical protein JSR97_02800 [Verrucomicrobia bacterium]|nr:hypothetical protein [Verrucomicrobiota bacterium]MBX2919735.1 hypothetical protein [Ferruginibacter sp.]
MDTRVSIYTLIDHKEFYGDDKPISVAQNLIRNIPSVTLLNYVSGFNVNLYLNEHSEDSGKIQAYLIDNLVSRAGGETLTSWKKVLNKQVENGHAPVVIWNYSNLLFYSLIFKRFNNLPSRDLSQKDAKAFFEAYLIVNSSANKRIAIEEEELRKAIETNTTEDVLLPNFIYQKDYASTTDFSNQVTRGVLFFEYLEKHGKYGTIVQDYYKAKGISGHLRMFKNLMVLFSLIRIENNFPNQRLQLLNVQEYYIGGDIDLEFIDSLCINLFIKTYLEDQSFGQLRNTFLYKLNAYQYFILDINFLIDYFYKAQVFAFNSYLKSRGVKDEFLSIKAKEFMEEIYLPMVFKGCFPSYTKYFGSDCVNSKKEELCDVYLRSGNKICLIEFKDVLLNASAKNSAVKETLFNEFDKKFVANEKNKAKGITQLINAVKDIEANGVLFDEAVNGNQIEVFPIVVYTDHSFGIDGLNKVYKVKFGEATNQLSFNKVRLKDITFINLNFFEIREDYLAKGLLDLFILLEQYHVHISNQDYQQTPFEVFSRFYMNENTKENLGLPLTYQNILSKIIAAK